MGILCLYVTPSAHVMSETSQQILIKFCVVVSTLMLVSKFHFLPWPCNVYFTWNRARVM